MGLCDKRVFKLKIAVETHILLFNLGSLHGGLQNSICFTGSLKDRNSRELPPKRDCAWLEEDMVYKDKMQHGLGRAQSHFTALLAVY